MNNVKDKVIIVTGGGQGLGAAICRTLAEDGATVIPVDIQQDKLEAITAELKSKGSNVEGFEMNVADEKSVEKTIQQIIVGYLKNGLYLLRIENEAGATTKKIVVQN